MARATSAVPRHAKKKKYFRAARGYFGGRSKLWRIAKNAVERGWVYSYRDRKNRKREFRRLWIQRINAGARQEGMTYSRLMNGLKLAGVTVNRKMLAEIAIADPAHFKVIALKAKTALESQKKAA
jgi:large subunit ribosomal protein L20